MNIKRTLYDNPNSVTTFSNKRQIYLLLEN